MHGVHVSTKQPTYYIKHPIWFEDVFCFFFLLPTSRSFEVWWGRGWNSLWVIKERSGAVFSFCFIMSVQKGWGLTSQRAHGRHSEWGGFARNWSVRACVCVYVCVCFNVGMEFYVCLSGGKPDDDDRSRRGHGLMNETWLYHAGFIIIFVILGPVMVAASRPR